MANRTILLTLKINVQSECETQRINHNSYCNNCVNTLVVIILAYYATHFLLNMATLINKTTLIKRAIAHYELFGLKIENIWTKPSHDSAIFLNICKITLGIG